jgi:hypothetical protein
MTMTMVEDELLEADKKVLVKQHDHNNTSSVKDVESLGTFASSDVTLRIEEAMDDISMSERTAIEQRIIRKIDFYILPYLTILYLFAFLDRANIGKINSIFKKI